MKKIFMLQFLLLSSCINITIGSDDTPTITGIPVDENQVQVVFGYVNTYGPPALNKITGAGLENIKTIDFVQGVFNCEGTSECFGISEIIPDIPDNIKVSLNKVSYSELPTTDIECTSLTHELMHVMMYNLTGNPDAYHQQSSVWGINGMVNQVMGMICPGYTPYPQCVESYCSDPND